MGSSWKRAAVFGSLWAASEILLGSLLHALRIPLAGTLLAAIGVSILVAGLRLRGGPGVALRAGIVCALMKSVSPGAVIIGPMIGIMLEASIVEGVTRLTRRSAAGMLLAGALATATPIVQKIGGLLVTYGYNAADIYAGLYEFTANAIGIRGFGPTDLILIFAGAAALLGVVAAGTGLRIAGLVRRIESDPITLEPTASPFQFDLASSGQAYAAPLLAVHPIALGAGLALVSMAPLWIAAPTVAAYAALAYSRYRRVAQRLAKPGIWVEFCVVAVLAAVTLGLLTPGNTLADGLAAAGAMIVRGLLVIVALSSISVELRNPVVLGWFLRRGLDGLADALTVAASALPGIMRLLGDNRRLLLHPVRALSRALAGTVAWIDRVESLRSAPVFILSGAQGIGKTRMLEEVVRLLRSAGIEPRGFLSPAVIEGRTRAGYDLRLLHDGSVMPLARTAPESSAGSVGRFTFFEDAIRAGREALAAPDRGGSPLVIVDEVGPLEMLGRGWTPSLTPLIIAQDCPLILVVRPSLVNDVCEKWNLHPVEIWDASVIDAGTIWADLRMAFTDRALYSHAANGYIAGGIR